MIVSLFFSFKLKNNNISYNQTKKVKDFGYIYRDLGIYKYAFSDNSYIKVHAYIIKRLNGSGYYSNFRYEYVLMAVSASNNGRGITETWLYNNRIYMDNVEISTHQFPNGMTTYISTTPTAIYSWYSNEDEIGIFKMKWESSVYENR